MEVACSLLLPPSLPRASPHSLSSSNSILFSNGNRVFLRRKTTLVLKRTRGQNRPPCRCLFGLGVPELVVIAGVVALVFGPKKLPEVGRSIGKTLKSFQQAAKEFETELKKEPEATMVESPAEKSKSVSEEENQDLKI